MGQGCSPQRRQQQAAAACCTWPPILLRAPCQLACVVQTCQLRSQGCWHRCAALQHATLSRCLARLSSPVINAAQLDQSADTWSAGRSTSAAKAGRGRPCSLTAHSLSEMQVCNPEVAGTPMHVPCSQQLSRCCYSDAGLSARSWHASHGALQQQHMTQQARSDTHAEPTTGLSSVQTSRSGLLPDGHSYGQACSWAVLITMAQQPAAVRKAAASMR